MCADAGSDFDRDKCGSGNQRQDQNPARFAFVMVRVQENSPSLL